MNVGTHIGWPAAILFRLRDPENENYLDHDKQAMVVSALSISNIVCAIPAGLMSDLLGRKTMLFISFVPNVLCWLILAINNSYVGMIVSRIIGGVGFAIIATVGPVYLAEIAQDKVRGRLSTLFLVMFNFGILYEYTVTTYITQFNVMLSVTAITPIIFSSLFFWMPESPIYLIRHCRAAAQKVLMQLHGSSLQGVHDEMKLIDSSFLNLPGADGRVYFPCRKAVWKPLGLGFALIFFQQMGGATAILSFAGNVSQTGDVGPFVYGLSRLIVCLFVPFLVDSWGRRPLLMLSYSLSAVIMFVAGLLFYIHVSSLWAIDVLLGFYMMAQVLGAATLPMTIIAEMMPSDYRSNALAISQVIMGVMVLIVSRTFLLVIDLIGFEGLFWACSVNCVLALVFVIFVIPETKGKTFAQIQGELHGRELRFGSIV